MLSTTHTVTSAAIGATVGSAPVSFGLAFLFHLFADTLLHWNIYIDTHRRPYAWIVVDVLGGLLLAYALIPERFVTAPVLAAVLGGNLPDLWHGGLELLQKIRRSPAGARGSFARFHNAIQNETPNLWQGLAWQLTLILGAMLAVRL